MDEIKTDSDHATAVADCHRLMDAEPGTAAFERLCKLVNMIAGYERTRWPTESASQQDIADYLSDQGVSQVDAFQQ